MKVLVIGGLHGNEPLGVALVRELERNPIPNVTALFGNPQAVEKGIRFIEADLNRVFPGKAGGVTEERRAVFLMEATRGYDVVLDFHNTHAPRNDFGFVGGAQYGSLLSVAAYLGLKRVIAVDYDCINKYVPTCISVEVSLSSDENSVVLWLERVRQLAGLITVPEGRVKLFRYVKRVTREMQNEMRFAWEVGVPISRNDADQLGLPPREYLPVFVDDAYTPWNYAGLIAEIE